MRWWRDHPYLELGTTLSIQSDDVFSVNESFDEENASGVNLVHRRRDEGAKNKKKLLIKGGCRRCSKLVWILSALFVLLFIPMLGLSISAGIKRRKVPQRQPKNMEETSGFDQDKKIGDMAFSPKNNTTEAPSTTPLIETFNESTSMPSSAPHSHDPIAVSHEPTTLTSTLAPTLASKTSEPSVARTTRNPSSAPIITTSGPTTSPTTQSPTAKPTMAPITGFESILSQPTNIDSLTLPPEDTVLYIGVGNGKDTRRGGVLWKTDRLFQTNSNSIGTTLPCMDMEPQPLRGLFCKVRVGDQSYEIIPPTRDTDTFTAVIYVYNEGAPFTVFVQDKIVATDDEIGIFQLTTEPFVIPDSANGMISLRVQGDVAVAGLAIVAQKPTKEAVAEQQAEKEPGIEYEIQKDDPDVSTDEPVPNNPISVSPTYIPGQLTQNMMGLQLSQGLHVRLLAISGKPVEYADGSTSDIAFHIQPDAGATYALDDGGWIYVSNSEAKPVRGDRANRYPGGVGAFTFSADGEIIKYEMVLTETRANCGGGRTPWGAWISGEEYNAGKIWQVDPTGERQARRITMGEVEPGLFESFAYDARDMNFPRFFMTKDDESGALRRLYVLNACVDFQLNLEIHSTPREPDWSNPWEILTGNGGLDFLVLQPEDVTNALLGKDSSGAFYWESKYNIAADSASNYYVRFEVT